jgi:hypothetical protein
MTQSPANGSDAGAPRPDTSDMYAVHGVFRDTLGAAPALVGGVATSDTERLAVVANYYENVLSFLEAHHDGEEQLVFPLLRERCPDQAGLLDELAEQHDEALTKLRAARQWLAAWPGAGDSAQLEVVSALGELRTHLVEHLGLIRERMNEEQRVAMLAHMPQPAVDMWTGFGEHAFNELASQVVVEVQNRVP